MVSIETFAPITRNASRSYLTHPKPMNHPGPSDELPKLLENLPARRTPLQARTLSARLFSAGAARAEATAAFRRFYANSARSRWPTKRCGDLSKDGRGRAHLSRNPNRWPLLRPNRAGTSTPTERALRAQPPKKNAPGFRRRNAPPRSSLFAR